MPNGRANKASERMARTFEKIIKSRNLYEDVIRQIKKAILTGAFQNGVALPSEPELAKQFGVSRPVVREALRALQSSGFIEIRRGAKGGAFIRDIIGLPFFDDFPDLIYYRRLKVDHLAQARLLLEPEICRLAARNASDANIQAMKDLVKGYSKIEDPDEKDPYYTMFHRLMGRSCGNPLYTIVMESIMDFTEGFIRTIKPVRQFIHKDDDHDEIIDALEKRDPERAAEVGTRHAEQILKEMRKLEQTYLKLIRSEYQE
jgi:GntR family transcriptional repressor for pyruvate dehydrogenase complex